MNKLKNENKQKDILESKKQFEKIVKISLIIGICVIFGFIVFYILTPEPGYVTFGILNSDKQAENYPTNSTVGQNVSFYITVGNYLKKDSIFQVEILRGDENNTILKPEGSINATSVFNVTQIMLEHNDQWVSNKLNISFSQPGPNQLIIAELWEIDLNFEQKFHAILWLRLNITT